MEEEYVLYFDGCSKGNPGIAGAGSVIYKNEEEIYAESTFVGDYETNNVAEYTGLIIGLGYAVNNKIQKLLVRGDSNLVIKQMNGEYQVKSTNIKDYYDRAIRLAREIPSLTFQHVYRNDNKRADELANMGILTRGH
jgi:ribonuclease HI